MSPLRAASLLIVALGLSACGGVHPGAAAVVDGRVISMETLDRTADVYCLVTARSAQQGAQQVDNAQVRRQAANDLVMHQVARKVVEERGITVDPTLTELPASQVESIRAAFGDDADEVVTVFRRSQRLYAELIAIGADETGRTPNQDILDPLAQAGQQAVLDAYPTYDVTFASRLGLSDDGQPDGGVGSLSVPGPGDEKATPPSGPVGCSA